MKRLILAAGLIATLVPNVWAQDTKPAVQATELSAREQGALGTYKSDNPAAPTITIKAAAKQLIMSATGFPDIPVTLNDKDELTAALLPEGYKFSLIRDKDKKVTGLKVETPMGGGDFQRVPDAPAVKPAPKPSVPDILGVYESDTEFQGMIIKSEVVLEKGKLVLKNEGQPDSILTLQKDDTLLSEPALPDGITIKVKRDKDGKVIGSVLTAGETKINFTRKTFPKPPGAEAPAAAAIPDVLGKYEPEDASNPLGTGEIVLSEGKLVLKIEGQPDFPITVDKDGKITAANFPDGVSAKFVKDKDGKVIKIAATTPLGELSFIRKTFPKPPAAEAAKPTEAKPADATARLKALEGTYTSEVPGLPTVTMTVKDGKLIIVAEGNPEMVGKLSDKDELTGEGLPEGFSIKIQRDKDGKVTGMKVTTPMGDAVFTRKPL